MLMSDYARVARGTAVYPGQNDFDGLVYTALGMVGEAGEFADKLKKVLRDDNCVLTEEKRQALIKELGDVLWYVSQCAYELNTTMSQVALLNLEKLRARAENGKIQGSGDDR